MESPDETSPDEFICKPLNNFMANLLLAAKRNLEDTESATMNTEPTASQSNKPWESHSEKIHDVSVSSLYCLFFAAQLFLTVSPCFRQRSAT
jgi:hypothetical protein